MMDEGLQRKTEKLKELLLSYGQVAVAFSGGVDSTFLLYAAREALKDEVIAVTAASCSFPEREEGRKIRGRRTPRIKGVSI